MKTALFLGAGASVFAGIPTTRELIRDIAKRARRNERWANDTAMHLAVNIVRAHEHDGKDVEELYQAIQEMTAAEELHRTVMEYKAGDEGGGKKREIRTTAHGEEVIDSEANDITETIRTLKSLRTTIHNTLLARLVVKPERYADIVSTYDELFGSVSGKILTTNHDNVLETYCEQKKLDLANGFEQSHLGDGRTWSGKWRGGESVIDLTKMHGSITRWRTR